MAGRGNNNHAILFPLAQRSWDLLRESVKSWRWLEVVFYLTTSGLFSQAGLGVGVGVEVELHEISFLLSPWRFVNFIPSFTRKYKTPCLSYSSPC